MSAEHQTEDQRAAVSIYRAVVSSSKCVSVVNSVCASDTPPASSFAAAAARLLSSHARLLEGSPVIGGGLEIMNEKARRVTGVESMKMQRQQYGT